MIYFYTKIKKKIVPCDNAELNKTAKKILNNIKVDQSVFSKLPKKFQDNWKNVSLYSPSGDINKADSLLLNPDDGAYHLKNKINHMTGKEWIKFSCSWFIFNALPEDLKQEKELDPNTEDHPATFSPTMISSFIKFFTKEGDSVLDPFMGIGSTAEACRRTGRVAYGTELNKKYYDLSLKRTPEFNKTLFLSDAAKIKELDIPDNSISLSISSPPYWDILNRSTRDFKKTRDSKNFDVNYSDHDLDLGNMDNYDKFINSLADIYFNMYEKLKVGAYIVIIVKNVKKQNKLYPIAWDIASKLSSTYVLKDEKIWIQDKVALAPYGYPYSWASNILHHYCIILRKE